MNRSLSIICVVAALSSSQALAAGAATRAKAPPRAKAARAKALPAPAKLPVGEIVQRNIAARGGLAAWRKVNALTMSGEMDAGGKKEARLPFVMSLKRPRSSRLELTFKDQTAVQVWNGTQGWKVRPYLDRGEVEPYTAAEARSAAEADELDGPLMDLDRKGTKVELAGTEVVEGRNTYKLALTRKDGARRNLWIDASTFLETKIDGEPRKLDGRLHPVTVHYRDFRREGGLQFPHTLETVVDKVKGSHKISIKTIKVNPSLDDGLFAKPQLAPGKLAAR